MPLVYQQNINESSRLAIWHLQEKEDFFLRSVTLQQPIHHPHKRLQHLAGRFLLQHLDPAFPLDQILISATNKPYLRSEQFHFSISHCGDYAAVILSNALQVGIDIELVKEKILSIRSKFMNESEYELLDEMPRLQLATMIWSAKEAVYKWYGTGSVDFKKHIHIVEIVRVEDGFRMAISFFKNGYTALQAHSKFLGEFCLTWIS